MAGIDPVHRNVDDRPRGMALLGRNADLVHQPEVARSHLVPVDCRDDACAGYFPYARNPGSVRLLPVSCQDAPADRVA